METLGLGVSEACEGTNSFCLCKELLPEGHCFQDELQEVSLPDGHFDNIRVDNALEHVPNPKEVIAECCRLLCSGGQLMVYVPHGRSLSMRLMKGNSISAWIPLHLQVFMRKSLNWLLEGAGLNPPISPVPSAGATGQPQITRINSIRIYEYNPTSWLPASIMQWRNRNQVKAEYNHPRWLTLAWYPIGWRVAKSRPLHNLPKIVSEEAILNKISFLDTKHNVNI